MKASAPSSWSLITMQGTQVHAPRPLASPPAAVRSLFGASPRGAPRRRRPTAAAAGDGDGPPPAAADPPPPEQPPPPRPAGRAPRAPDSTDFIASSLTRRFGIGGGLAYLAFLTAGVLGEQIATRSEQATEAAGTRDVADAAEVVTPEGLRVRDERLGGGQAPAKGLLAVVHFKAYADGALFEDTAARGKPVVLLFGGRPIPAGLCPGAELALGGMRAGGRRVVTVPAGSALGFGAGGAALRPSRHAPDKALLAEVPPGAELRYELELLRVSVPPS